MTESALTIAYVVLHTSPLDTPGTKDAGGMNVVVRAHAEQLAARGHRVQLITRRSDPSLPDTVELGRGLSAHHLDAGPDRLLAKGDHEGLVDEFGRALAAHLRAHPVDIIHAQHWYSGVAALPVARELGVPILQSYHSIAAAEETPLTEGERPEAPGRLAAEARLAREVDLVVTVSEAERRTVIERLGAEPERVRVVNPGVDTELFHPAESGDSPHARAGQHEVLVAGRLHPLKGFDLAIAAVAKLAKEVRPTLRIVGSPPPDGGEYVRSLHAAVAAADMGDTVVFDGALDRDELANRLRETSLVLITSHSETFGLVALEAAASGVPVIARAVGGLREAVVHGETGLLIESAKSAEAESLGEAQGEAQTWAEAIAELLDDPERMQRLGQAGRELALRSNWAASAEAMAAVYRELLSELQQHRL